MVVKKIRQFGRDDASYEMGISEKNKKAFFRMRIALWCVSLVMVVFCSGSAKADQFIRKSFEYDKMGKKAAHDCDKSQSEVLDLAIKQVAGLKSTEAVVTARKVYSLTDRCPRADGVYAWCLFRSGEWLKAIEVIDAAIETFGSEPNLVKTHAYMSLEMGDLGTMQKIIDGNGVFSPRSKSLPFDDEQFKKENYKAALNDFLFIVKGNPEEYDLIFNVAYLHYMLGDYEKSNKVLEKLLETKEQRAGALTGMVNNYIAMKQFNVAEKALIELESEYPKVVSIQKQFVYLYTATGETAKLQDHNKKLQFYNSVPSFTDLQYTEETHELVAFIENHDNKAEEKRKKFEAFLKGRNKEAVIDICLTVLAMHPHGTGLEEMATNELVRIGKDSVPKTIRLLQSARISTCTITNAADILATIKDERGWQPLVDCLPGMTRLPSTLIPPFIPDKIIKFDRDRGIRTILPFLRDMIRADQNGDASKDPAKGMVYFAFFDPLKSFDRDDLVKLAKEFKYTETEIQILLKNTSKK